MASFTDQISQFNPYIQELPVEAMVQVGMAKQAQYNQGVQKVQNYVDRVAGLEIAKPQHKQYLQSKMDELGNRLKTVAAGDFSNQQLVNSVSGMTGQIIKDPIVQTAVYSTQVLKKGESDREIAVKAGKTSPANDDLWNDTKSAWFNDADLNTPFGGKFIERWDVDKKLTERAEMILKNPDVINQEQRFKHDEKGNTLYFGTEPVKDKDGKAVIDPKTKEPVLRQTISTDPSKGQPEPDDAILKISVKGVSAEKLYNNFLDSLDSRDAQQLKIDARYKYKNATAESFAPDIAKFYGDKKAFQSQEIVNLTGALAEPDLTSEQKAAITAKIADLQQQEKDGVIDKEFLSTMEALKDPRNLEKYKEDIYTQQHLMNMAKDMSFKSYEQEIKSNPYMQMFMQKQNYNLDVIRFNDDSRAKWANIDIARNRFEFDKFDKNRDYAYKVKKDELDNPPPIITTTTLPTLTTPKTVASQFAVAGEKADLMKGLKNKYASRLFPGLTVDQQQEAFSNLYKRYDTNPNGNYSPDEVEFLNSYRRANTDMLMASNLATAAEKIKTEEEAKVYKNVAGAGGYSKEDIINVVKELGKFNPKEALLAGVLGGATGYMSPGTVGIDPVTGQAITTTGTNITAPTLESSGVGNTTIPGSINISPDSSLKGLVAESGPGFRPETIRVQDAFPGTDAAAAAAKNATISSSPFTNATTSPSTGFFQDTLNKAQTGIQNLYKDPIGTIKGIGTAALDYTKKEPGTALALAAGAGSLATLGAQLGVPRNEGEDDDSYAKRLEGVQGYITQYGKNLSIRDPYFYQREGAVNPFAPTMAANGGIMGYRKGGSMVPPARQIEGGIIELDARKSGGYIPYGKKERVDDVPAMLAKDEFVFTSRAVKAAGGGSAKRGAEKMYALMKQLESKGARA